MKEELLARYNQEQKEVINWYWDTIRWTRQTGTISDGIKNKELEFWQQFEVDVVIEALEIHIDQAPNIKEHYTRGIMRNKAAEKSIRTNNAPNSKIGALSTKKQNRFCNFEQPQHDFNEFERQERQYIDNELGEDKDKDFEQIMAEYKAKRQVN